MDLKVPRHKDKKGAYLSSKSSDGSNGRYSSDELERSESRSSGDNVDEELRSSKSHGMLQN
jgi:hypothetical protein